MKRLLILLLCLSLFLPVLALGEEEEVNVWDLMEEEDAEVDEDGNIVVSEGGSGDFDLSEEDFTKMFEDFEIDDSVDASDLYLNENLPDDVINILLLGLDVKGTKKDKLLSQQEKYAKRADVQIILSISKYDGSIKLTSIARNTYVNVPDRKNNTIIANSYGHAIYKNGEYDSWADTPYMTMATVNLNFEMNIQYYVATNFYGVASIIEYLGGVDIELTKQEASAINTYLSMGTIRNSKGEVISHGKEIANTYDDKEGNRQKLEKKNGVQHLDGIQGLMYARLRSIDNDFNRTGRTRKLLSSLLTPTIEKINSGELKIDKLIPELLYPYFKTNMNALAIMEVVYAILNGDVVANMDMMDSLVEEFRIPEDKTYHYDTINGASVVVLNDRQKTTEALHEFIFGAYYPAD